MRKQNIVEHLATLGTLVRCYEKSLKVFKFLLDNQRRLWYNKTIVRKEKISHVKRKETSADWGMGRNDINSMSMGYTEAGAHFQSPKKIKKTLDKPLNI